MLKKVLAIAVLITTLNVCTPYATSTTPTSPIVPTSVYTSTPQPTIRPSATPKPSVTPYFIDTKGTATSQAFNQLKTIFPGMCDSFQWSFLKSPDENWLAQDCFDDSLQIINRNGVPTKRVTYKEIFGTIDGYPYNEGALQPLHWTYDNQYLYFSVRYCCWDPGIMLLAVRATVYRVNINNGEYSSIRSGVFDSSFSPIDRRIAFIEELTSPPTVEIQDLTTGIVDKVRLNVENQYAQANVDAWSSDSLRFVVSAASGSLYDYNTEDVPVKFSVFIIDVKNLS